jgi:hypothetical protein
MINLSVAFLVSSGDYGSTGGERCRRASVDFCSENFFSRTACILFPGSELVSCDTLKSFAARHGKLKSRESRFFAERAKNNQLCVTCHFSIFSFHYVVT